MIYLSSYTIDPSDEGSVNDQALTPDLLNNIKASWASKPQDLSEDWLSSYAAKKH